MTVAALMIALVSALAAALGVFYAWQSARAARGSEMAAKEAAEAAQKQAAIGAAQLELEMRRVHHEMTPVLVGIVKDCPIPGRPGLVSYQLEIQTKTPQPIVQLTITLPRDSWISIRGDSSKIMYELSYPGPGDHPVKIEPGCPARWSVEVARKPALGTIIGIASCRGGDGEAWDGIEVPITMDSAGDDATS